MSEIAVERVDGLGWVFPLFFLVHAAAPGVAATACAIAFGQAYTVPLVIASVAAYLPIWLVIRAALKKKARIERYRALIAGGHRAWATVAHKEMLLGHAKSGGKRYRRAVVWLRVEPQGFAPYDVETQAWYRAGEIASLAPGARVPVAVSPEDPTDVVILDIPTGPVWAPPVQHFGGYRMAPLPIPPAAAAVAASTKRSDLILVLSILVLTTAPLVFVFGYGPGEGAAEVVQRFLARLDKADYDGAYALLSEDLQDDVGTPDDLGERWEAAGIRAGKLGRAGCSSGGFGKWRIGRSAAVTKGSSGSSFTIGKLGGGKCRRQITAETRDNEAGNPRIVAISVN